MRTFFTKYADHKIAKYAAEIFGDCIFTSIWHGTFFGWMDSTAIISTLKLIAKLESTCGFAVARFFGLYSIFFHLKLDIIT